MIGYTIDMDGTEISTGDTSTSYTKTGLSAGTTYIFRVRANNAIGNSAYSSTVLITSESDIISPSLTSESDIISPSFLSEPETKLLKLSQLSEWTLPEIDEGSFPPVAVECIFDN